MMEFGEDMKLLPVDALGTSSNLYDKEHHYQDHFLAIHFAFNLHFLEGRGMEQWKCK